MSQFSLVTNFFEGTRENILQIFRAIPPPQSWTLSCVLYVFWVLEFLHHCTTLTSQVFPSLFFSRRVWSRIYWFPIWTVPIVLVGTWTIEYLTMICASQKSATMALWKRRNIATLESNANLDQLQKISSMADSFSQLI